jgi:Protein of unknown function (DUF4240)
MDREDFWALIETAKTATGSDCRAQAAQLVAALAERSVDEVLAWDRIDGEPMAEPRSWEAMGSRPPDQRRLRRRRLRLLSGLAAGPRTRRWQAARADPDSLAAHPEVRGRRPLEERSGPLECDDML